jgi:hypothetical protein
MPLTNAPLQELPLVTIENGVKTIYCFEIELKQDDLGYAPPKEQAGVPAAVHDVMVYADTVSIRERLMLPGKNLGIFARKLILAKGAAIDVSGATAASSFAPSDMPKQNDLAAGAKGSAGAGGTTGGNAGNVTLAVDEIVGPDPGSFGRPEIEAVNLPLALTERFQQAFAKSTPIHTEAFSTPIQFYYMGGFMGNNDPNPYPFTSMIGTLQVSAGTPDGWSALKVENAIFSGDGKSVSVTMSAASVKVSLQSTLDIQQTDSGVSGKQTIPLASAPVALRATVVVQIDPKSGTLASAKVDIGAPIRIEQTPRLDGKLGPVGTLVADMLNKSDVVGPKIRAAIGAAVQGIADVAMRELNGTMQSNVTPDLAVYARGHIGGRGQDGHYGIKGSKGVDGKKTETIVYDAGNGQYTTPPETCGKKGNKGGQAGDAGHSGEGGKGGAISVNFMNAAPLRILLFADGGPGGEAASPGARGEGGDGGDGVEFLVRQLSMQGNYGYTAQGPDGPRGDQGDLANFNGAAGQPGAQGTVNVNGAVYSGTKNPIAACSYDLMAPLLKLDQLLMTQRIAKLMFLNAKAKADYDRVATLFLWLCNVSPDSVTGAGAKNTIPPDERVTRAAIHHSASVQLLRMRRGLDYFGHPYNWAPVLRLKHTQERVNQLIALGRIVEEQYNAYNAENKSVKEKLQALDTTLTELAADLRKSKTAETALDHQIELAASAIASLQTDIETQTSVMKRNQADLEDTIHKKISDQCSIENIIKVGSAIIAIGAGAFNGVSEIAGAAELATIFAEAKKAAEAAGQLKTEIEKIQKATATFQGLADQLKAVDGAIAAKKPDSVKIAVAKQEFEENIKPLIKEFPTKSKELRAAVRGFFDLAQTRNEKIWDYNALFVQKAELIAHRAQVEAQIGNINTIKSQNKEALVPAPYVSFFRSALTWSKENLIRLLHEEMRAFCYHSGAPRKDLVEELSDLNMGTLANTQGRLITEYDQFLESVGRPYSAINDIRVTISKEDEPSAFESLASTGRITFTISHTSEEFAGLTLVKAQSVEVHLPGITGGKSDELNVAMVMMGEGAVRPPDKTDEASVVYFNSPPRPISFKYSFDASRANPVVQAAQISDSEFAPLSPFTTWTLDFGMKANLNKFVDFKAVDAIEMRFDGNAFGRRAMAARRASNSDGVALA